MIPFDNVVSSQAAYFAFGDRRLNRRCMDCIAQIDKVGAHNSFPRIFKGPYQLKGFYRLMNHPNVEHEAFLKSYQQGLVERVQKELAAAPKQPFYLFSDSTFCKYNARNKLTLGYMETIKDNGVILHSGTLTDAQWVPMGVGVQQLIVRDPADFGKSHQRGQKPFEQKESFKWTASIDWAKQVQQQTGAEVIQIMDREADIADLFNYAFAQGQSFIIRAWHNRQVLDSDLKLWPYLRQLQPAKQLQRQLLDRKGKPQLVKCELRYTRLRLDQINQAIYGIHLQALDTDIELEVTEWLLLTNLNLDQAHQAEHCIDAYTHRWGVCEDFHKALKTGCSIEKRQFDSLHALANTIALLSLVAIRLLRMRYLAKVQGHRPVEQVLQGDETQLAQVLAQQHLTPTDLKYCQPNTVLWWVLLLGRLGGHQGYSQKGLPGWQTLFHGWNYFQNLLKGINLSKNFFPKPDP